MANAFGGLYVTGGSTGQALSTTAARMTGFTTAYVGTSTREGDQSVVPVAASDWVTLKPGTYLVNFDCSGTNSTANVGITADLRAGTTAVATVPKGRNEAPAINGNCPISFSGTFVVSTEANYSVFLVAASGTPSYTPVEANLSFVRLDG